MIMGLTPKQVCDDGFDWSQGMMMKSAGMEIPQPPAAPAQPARPQQKQRQPAQQQQQQGPPLRCPRCDSTNTKFCYYNNYSRVQPRHFCKACRRHWTEGGTLRNVPVGGGRKAKRQKTSHPSSAPEHPTGNHRNGVDDSNIQQPPQLLPPLSFAPDMLCSALLQTSLPPSDYANSSYLASLLPEPPTPQFVGTTAGMVDAGSYPFSTSSTFFSFLDLPVQEDLAGMGSDTALAGSTATSPPWELLPPPPTCSSGPSGSTITTTSSGLTVLDSSSPSSGYWGKCWEDLTGFLSSGLEHPPANAGPPLPQYF